MDVLGFGENSVDYVYRVTSLTAGAKARIDSRSILPGGQAATTMAGCAALGLRARYVGSFGNDRNAEIVRAELIVRGVDVGHAIVREAPNRYAVILVDPRGERSVSWARDDKLQLHANDVRGEWFADARLVHVDAVDEDASIALATAARAAGLPVTCDIDTVTPRTQALLAAASIPILAESVPEALTGETDPERALRKLRHEGMIVVTLGARGSMLLQGKTLHVAAAPAVTVVDTTGAGDVFRAGFIYGLLQGWDPPALLRFANAAAAASCTRQGAMTSVPSQGDVQAFLSSTNPSGGTTSAIE